MGLGDPCDTGPAHPHHDHRNPAGCRLRDDHCQRHQNYSHLRRGHHPKESKAVSIQTVAGVKLEDLRCPTLIICGKDAERNGLMDTWRTFLELLYKCSLLHTDLFKDSTAFYLWDCFCIIGS